MKFRTVYISLLFLCLLPSLCVGQDNSEIGLYDLRYTLKIDTSNSKNLNKTWDHCHAVAALQGIVNRDKPRLYILYVDSQIKHDKNIDQYWLDKYTQPNIWLSDKSFLKYERIEDLINAYRNHIKGAVLYDSKVPATSNVASAVAGAEDLIPIRYDTDSDSLYSKLVISGAELPVKVSLVNEDGSSKFTGKDIIADTNIPSTGSAKCDAYIWMKNKYMDRGKLNCLYGGYYIDYYWAQNPLAAVLNHHTLTNHDYFISKKAFFFDLSPWADEVATDDPIQRPGVDRDVMKQLLLSAYKQTQGEKIIHIGGFPPWAFKYTKHAGGRHDDVPTEWEYTTIISAYNAFQDADAIGFGACANASFWQHYPLKEKYPQKWVTREQLKEKGYLTENGKVNFNGRKFIIFYVGDYDSSSWVYQRVMDIWDDTNRGKVPMMWCISPVLDRRIPMAMEYIRNTATENDYFAAADNGAGYINPGMLQYHRAKNLRPISNLPTGIDTWQKHCKKYYDKWGLTISGFIIDGYAPGLRQQGLDCYQSFSPNGLIWQKGALSLLYKNMPILRADLDINQGDPVEAARRIIRRSKEWPLPFHWFRNILKSPTWYVGVVDELKKEAPHIELLDAPTFFELYRIYLENHPDAAQGKYPQFMFFW